MISRLWRLFSVGVRVPLGVEGLEEPFWVGVLNPSVLLGAELELVSESVELLEEVLISFSFLKGFLRNDIFAVFLRNWRGRN